MKVTEDKIAGRHILFIDAENDNDDEMLERIGPRGSRFEGQMSYTSSGAYLTIEVWRKPE